MPEIIGASSEESRAMARFLTDAPQLSEQQISPVTSTGDISLPDQEIQQAPPAVTHPEFDRYAFVPRWMTSRQAAREHSDDKEASPKLDQETTQYLRSSFPNAMPSIINVLHTKYSNAASEGDPARNHHLLSIELDGHKHVLWHTLPEQPTPDPLAVIVKPGLGEIIEDGIG